MRRRAGWVVLCLGLGISPVEAQSDSSGADAPVVSFLTRAALRLSAEHLGSADPRFVWDTNFGGEIDLIDYGAGRATFVANYQAMLGEELRAFDPNQGNYILALSASGRLPRVELALVFHHESRHLSDRPKVQPVDWNMLGGRAEAALVRGGTRLDLRADLRGVVQRSYVDYQWELDTGLRGAHRLHAGVLAIGAGGLRLIGVDGTRGRGTQTGYRGEGGVRFEGRGAAAELFAAIERRIDPYQLEFATVTWAIAGFRLLTR
jgi:hypothetical protein